MKSIAPSLQPSKELPDEVMNALRQQVKAKSQADIARELGVSAATVNQALKGNFKGHVERFSLRVRGKYLKTVVVCPLLGSIGTHVCLEEQAKPVAYTNPQRVALRRACQQCPHRQRSNP